MWENNLGVSDVEGYKRKKGVGRYWKYIKLCAALLLYLAAVRSNAHVQARAGYAAAFYCLSLVLKHIPVGIAYAIWSGVGIVLIAVIGFTVFKQHLDWPAVLGLALIIAGVVVINVFSDSVSH